MTLGIRKILLLIGVFGCIWLGIQFLLPLLLPFVLGTLLALAAEPMTRRLEGLKLPRPAAVGISVTAAFSFLAVLALLLGALVLRQLRSLAGILPDLGQTAKVGIGQLESWLLDLSHRAPGSLEPMLTRNVEELFSDGTAMLDKGVSKVLALAGGVLTRIPDGALGTAAAILSGYMISARLPRIGKWLRRRFSEKTLEKLRTTARHTRATLGKFIGAQLKLSAVTISILLAGLILLRIDHAPFWALVVALVDILPILGTGTVLGPWAVISMIRRDMPRAMGLLGIYVIITVTRSVLEPRLLGRQLGMDSLVTLVAMYAGYRLWGVAGLIFSPILTATVLQLMLPSRENRS